MQVRPGMKLVIHVSVECVFLVQRSNGRLDDPIMVQDQDTDSSGDGALDEQDGNQWSLSTPSTSKVGSEAG